MVLLFTFFLIAGSFVKAQIFKPHWQIAGEDQKRYGLESGRIEYQFSGDSKGTEVVIFDHWGWREKRTVDKSTTTWGNTAEIKSTQLQDGNYSVSHMTGSSRARAYQDRLLQNSLQNSSKAVEVIHGLEIVKARGGKKVDSEKILGRKCDVYEIKNLSQKLWVWEGIVLRSEQKVLENKIVMVAVNLEPVEEFSEQNFALPEDVKIEGMPTSAGNE